MTLKLNMAVTEGAITIGPLGDNDVFYNPPQVFNRDLSMLMARVYAESKKAEHDARMEKIKAKGGVVTEFEGIKIIEPLAASGLRSLRYATELPKGLVKHVVANDLDPAASEHIKKNRTLNNVPEDLVSPSQGDANAVLHRLKAQGEEFDIIDLDPYGSVAPFLDSAIYNIKDGGMICLTSTDMQILGGNSPEVSFYKYGGHPVKRGCTHELSVRLVYNAAVMTAAKYGRHIRPLMCLSVDFYVRLFLLVENKPFMTKLTSYQTAQALCCVGCESFSVLPLAIPPKDSKLGSDGRLPKQAESEEPSAKRSKIAGGEGAAAEETAEDLSGFAASFGYAPGCLGDIEVLAEESLKGNGRCRPNRLPADVAGSCKQCGSAIQIIGPFARGAPYCGEFLSKVLGLMTPANEEKTEEKTEETSEETGQEKKEKKVKPSYAVPDMPYLTMNERIFGVLSAVTEELHDVPLGYNLPALFKLVNSSQMPLRKFKGALEALGYRTSHHHREAQIVKTDAPDEVVWSLVRLYCKVNPPKREPAHPLLSLPIVIPENTPLDVEVNDRKRGARFRPNPRAYWGPKARATGKDTVTAAPDQETTAQETN